MTEPGTAEAANKRQKVASNQRSADPDLTIVVVGGKAFKEHSTDLRRWTNFFDTAPGPQCSGRALRSAMLKETQTKRFEFPDENPTEWEWIMALTAPLPSVTVTKENVHTALSWFNMLSSRRGLVTCDRVVNHEIVSALLPEAETRKNFLDLKPKEIAAMRSSLDKLLDTLATGIQYRLAETKAACYEMVKRVLRRIPSLFEVQRIAKVVSILKDDEGSCKALWSAFQQFLPPSISNQEPASLVNNGLLPPLLYSEILRKGTECRKQRRLEQEKVDLENCVVRMWGAVANWTKADAYVRTHIKQDSVCHKHLKALGWM